MLSIFFRMVVVVVDLLVGVMCICSEIVYGVVYI